MNQLASYKKCMVLALSSLLLLPLAALGRPTQLCNTAETSQIYFYGVSDHQKSLIMAAVANPVTDPDLYARLWEPLRASLSGDPLDRWLFLDMDPFQDLPEIVAAIRNDPLISTWHLLDININGFVCGLPPPPIYQRVTEYHNTLLDHYFLSSTEEENAKIDAGGAGPGWIRTGESFLTIPPGVGCSSSRQVFRFYGPGPNSHFYTADPMECGGLRTWDSGWIGEGVAFGATLPVNGSCTGYQETPVYRFYNNRWQFNDSNHRYTIRPEIYQEMVDRGWVSEGVALCVSDGHDVQMPSAGR